MQEKCFLDFRLGMRNYDYVKTAKALIEKDILQKLVIKEPYELDKKILKIKFGDIGLEGIIEPIFFTDRLDQLRIFFGEGVGYEQNKKVTIRDYEKVVRKLSTEYGQPLESKKDSETEHRFTSWETESYKVTALFVPEYELSKDQINIFFEPTKELEESLEQYNKEKKLQRE